MTDSIDAMIQELTDDETIRASKSGESEITHAEKVADTKKSGLAVKAFSTLVRKLRSGRISEKEYDRELEVLIRAHGFFA